MAERWSSRFFVLDAILIGLDWIQPIVTCQQSLHDIFLSHTRHSAGHLWLAASCSRFSFAVDRLPSLPLPPSWLLLARSCQQQPPRCAGVGRRVWLGGQERWPSLGRPKPRPGAAAQLAVARTATIVLDRRLARIGRHLVLCCLVRKKKG